ncbi:MAG: nucleotide exchange factor GrpE [Hyphomicrobiales bacterium]|jgi:molecular chaperone GrpE|nr:nucleotide exchange factor GrpE [Hyphomicrobiales bacterium]NBR12834.1 nucleotide exchange factor GrpE [Alphaproteobacteria bacterium]
MSEHDQSATPDQQNDAAQNSTESASGKEADVFAIIDALNAENAQLKDKALRTMADMENLRRRTEKEVVDARTYAVSSFARDMLTVADNMRRGIESVPQEQRTSADGALKTLLEGVELTERDLLKTLEKYGIKQIDPQGQRFDPNLHQAMFEVEDTSVTTGTVVQVVQAGFVIGERVLRPALVGVSKGGPKPGVDTSA